MNDEFQDNVALSFMLFENLGFVLNTVVPLHHYLKPSVVLDKHPADVFMRPPYFLKT